MRRDEKKEEIWPGHGVLPNTLEGPEKGEEMMRENEKRAAEIMRKSQEKEGFKNCVQDEKLCPFERK